MGEEVDNYNYDENGTLTGITHEGSWEAGLDVAGTGSNAEPGWLMRDVPTAGQTYLQELYPGEAEDMAAVVATGVSLTLADGSATYTGCVQTIEWNPLEPGHVEYKWYAPGVGEIRAESLDEGEFLEIDL